MTHSNAHPISSNERQPQLRTPTFIADQLPVLSRDSPVFPNNPHSNIRVINADSFAAARGLISEFGIEATRGKVAVLNMANDRTPGGGWLSLSTAQEEALCYSSTLYSTLNRKYYPWPNLGPGSAAGIYSSGVVIYRDDLNHDCKEFPEDEWRVVSVLTVAAPRHPKVTPDQEFAVPSHLEDLREKIRLVYRMAALNGNQFIVLAALGCGAFKCPAKVVSREMKTCYWERSLKGGSNRSCSPYTALPDMVLAISQHLRKLSMGFNCDIEYWASPGLGTMDPP